MKHLTTLIALILAIAATAMAREVADIPNVHVADRTRYVSNPDGVLSDAAVSELDRRLGAIWQQTTAEPVVVAVASIPDDTDIDSYATAIFEAWGIGKKDNDNGVLMVIARDDRKAVIRTGYGAEGALPDIVCGRILRNAMFPRFKQSDYDGGVIAGVEAMGRALTDPAYADELRSSRPSDSASSGFDSLISWETYLKLAALAAVLMLVYTLYEIMATRRLDTVTRWNRLHRLMLPALVMLCLTLGMALPALLVVWWKCRRLRSHRKCPNCSAAMKKIDEEHDNDYLTPAQDTEERINSVDYDVWVCPNCRETDILPYVNKVKAYTECPHCGARACSLVDDRIIVEPTTRKVGRGEKVSHCRSCGKSSSRPYIIPMLVAPVIVGGVGNRGGGFGGGFSGGSFGGGLTGGGGASGGW